MSVAGGVSPRLLRHPLGFLSLGFGSGLVPVAPGTAGTLAAIPVYLLMQDLALNVYIAVVGLLFLAGIPICTWTTRQLGVHDHPAIVWDEITGYLVTMIAAPAGWMWMLAGFLLFRLFDVAKPWPITWCDRHVHGGFGIMLDDLLAGVFAALLLQLLNIYL
ncbi:MAG: phosphatidylglycerophosphatase A [Gammaproteobacteria bacterium]|nr:MAG: phosphatidylglycerophosphatase A [Gammaproteobacteria bacterium]